MPISLAQLQTFVRLAELGNFTRTAEEFDLTPPAITLQVRTLAEHFGTALIDVRNRRPVLTPAGAYLAERAGTVIESVAALEREMERFLSGESQPLVIGATVTVGTYLLAPILAAFESKHSHGDIDVRVDNPPQLAALLRTHEVSIVLGSDLLNDGDFDVAPFAEDHLVLIVPAVGHRFSGRRSVRGRDIISENFVSREIDSPTRVLADAALAAQGLHIHHKLIVPSLEGVTNAVEAGLGVAIVSGLVAQRLLLYKRVQVVEIRDLDLRREFHLVTLRGAQLSGNAQLFSDFLRTSTIPQYRRKSRPNLR